jgi:hypothetical protein
MEVLEGARGRILLAMASLVLLVAGLAATQARAAGVEVFVGYADTLRAIKTHFPTPWEGNPGVTYEGCSPSASCVFDAGAVRVVNNTGSSIHVESVTVKVSTCTYKMWAPATIAPEGQLIVTQTVSGAGDGCESNGEMDTSDVGPGGSPYAFNCEPDGVKPEVETSIDGTVSTFKDEAQVLNTGGFDLATCPSETNESTQWSKVGGPICPSSALTLAPPTQTHIVGETAQVTATFTNSCEEPLQGASVEFEVVSGPNAGKTGTGTTNSKGEATFSYSSLTSGTDTLQASVSNPAGKIESNTVQANWTAPFAAGGAFVISDENSAIGTPVTFWGAQWWKLNPLSTGLAPASFKGFASSPGTPSCGTGWTAQPGNSAPPPAGPLPPFMAVIVASSITKQGPTITGDTPHIVVVKTNPGYAPNPGHAGTGTVVSQVC